MSASFSVKAALRSSGESHVDLLSECLKSPKPWSLYPDPSPESSALLLPCGPGGVRQVAAHHAAPAGEFSPTCGALALLRGFLHAVHAAGHLTHPSHRSNEPVVGLGPRAASTSRPAAWVVGRLFTPWSWPVPMARRTSAGLSLRSLNARGTKNGLRSEVESPLEGADTKGAQSPAWRNPRRARGLLLGLWARG